MRKVVLIRGSRVVRVDQRLAPLLERRAGYIRRDMVAQQPVEVPQPPVRLRETQPDPALTPEIAIVELKSEPVETAVPKRSAAKKTAKKVAKKAATRAAKTTATVKRAPKEDASE